MRKLLVITAVVLLAACQTLPMMQYTTLSRTEALSYQQTLLGAQNLDLSQVITVRLLVNGTRVDVTSLAPEVLALEGEGDARAATVMVFSADRSELVLFTRNPETGEGMARRITPDELRTRPVFQFPMVVGSTVTNAKFEVIDVIVR